MILYNRCMSTKAYPRHKPEDEEFRTRIFAESGYSTLIIWEHDLREDPKLVRERILAFEDLEND